jgi:hypothetical protein
MEFDDRLKKVIERGRRLGDARAEEEARRALSEQELRRLHGQYRIQLTERIERCLKRLPYYFPGFQVEPVVSDRGWGTAASRDDLQIGPKRARTNRFSRLEMLVSPVTKAFVLELSGKGTVRNKEVFNRIHYQPLAEADVHAFTEMVDLWVLEFAEAYSAASQ